MKLLKFFTLIIPLIFISQTLLSQVVWQYNTSFKNSEIKTVHSGEKFYDSGGEYYDYNYGEKYVVSFKTFSKNRIKLNFNYFNIGSQHYFKVYDGNSTSSPLLGNYNIWKNPFSIESSSNVITIEFSSLNDRWDTREGWDADIEILVDPSTHNITWINNDTFTNGNVVDVTSGDLFYDTGGQSGNVLQTEDYTVTFKTNPLNRIMLNLIKGQIRSSDRLTFYDGENTSAPIIEDLNGYIYRNTKIFSTGNYLTVKYKGSHRYYQPYGWEGAITVLENNNFNAGDCIGAKPICSNFYTESSPSIYNEGFVTNEIKPKNSACIPEESRGVWYSFIPQNTGKLKMFITPNKVNDDYDWVVFDMTGVACSELAVNADLFMVSSNNCGGAGNHGATGADSDNPRSGDNCQGPGNAGTQWNSDINVIKGHEYLLYISNWTSTSSSGYTIQFGGDAVIVDNNPPAIDLIRTPCINTNTIEIEFNKFIDVRSIDISKFDITKAGIDYIVTACNGNKDNGNSYYSKSFTLSLDKNLTQTGVYNISLNIDQVEDLCGNISSTTINSVFDIFDISADAGKPIIIDGANPSGILSGSASGQGITYNWTTTNGNIVNNATTLTPTINSMGEYKLMVTDVNGCIAEDAISIKDCLVPENCTEILGEKTPTQNAIYTYKANIPIRAQDFNWTISPNTNVSITPNNNTVDIEFNNNATGHYSLKVKALNSCGESNAFAKDIYISNPGIALNLTNKEYYNGEKNIVDEFTITPSTHLVKSIEIEIKSGFQSGDVLELKGTYPNISTNYTNGKLTITSSANVMASTFNTLVKNVVFKTSSSIKGIRKIEYKIIDSNYNPSTGHYYQYSSSSLSIYDALNACSNSTYFGKKGYLATISSTNENNFITSIANGNRGWIGASDVETEGMWKWISGPEAGTKFWQGDYNGGALNSKFSNWKAYQPDNWSGAPKSLGENYAVFYNGQWQDSYHQNVNNTYVTRNYIIEFGGLPNDKIPYTEIEVKEFSLSLIQKTPIKCMGNAMTTTVEILPTIGLKTDYLYSTDNINFTANTEYEVEIGSQTFYIREKASLITKSKTFDIKGPRKFTISEIVTDATCTNKGKVVLNISDGTTYRNFDGNSYIALNKSYNSLSALNKITLSAWIKVEPNKGGFSILDFDKNKYFNVAASNANKTSNNLIFGTTSGSLRDNFKSIKNIRDNKWHHICCVYDGIKKYIYIDGVLDNETTPNHSGMPIGGNRQRFGFVGDASKATAFNGTRRNVYFEGGISELRFWERALSYQEIKKEMLSSYPNTQSLALYIPMTIKETNTFNDASGKNINLINSGSTVEGITYSWQGPNSFNATTKDINNIIPGNYTVHVIDYNGCKTSKEILVSSPTVNPPDVSSLTQVFCASDDITLSLSDSNIEWYIDSEALPENLVHTGKEYHIGNLASGTHYFWVRKTEGYCSSNLIKIEITIRPKPVLKGIFHD